MFLVQKLGHVSYLNVESASSFSPLAHSLPLMIHALLAMVAINWPGGGTTTMGLYSVGLSLDSTHNGQRRVDAETPMSEPMLVFL